ncbi:MAG: protein kinase [Gemmatimonadetes bacterium]|nr:protein kinase [Gemmatimonadota bacterium]MDA1104862.1 protein kinase [Gemmatimonadota bacterium]
MPDPMVRLTAALEGRYRVERELGEGGMAMVYLADDLRHERKVALKVLKPELAAVVGAERFLAEIKTTANLQHPHILPLFDSGEADGFLFYVMPFVEGETLADRIDREKQLPVDEALGIATAIANALQTAHDAGVVHRDIKPANILLSRGEPLVADFGIALAVGAAGGSRLTETGLSVGTPYYMSPEQATGDQSVGPASDAYALACVLYEMLVGEPPYLGNTAQAVLGKIIQGQPVSATSIRKSIPPNVDAAIRKGLEKLPADRFTGAHEFAKALADPTFRHGIMPDGAAGGPARMWNRLSVASTGVAVAALLALGWVTLGPRAPEVPLGVERFASPFRVGQEPAFFGAGAFAFAPNGSFLIYRGPPSEGMTSPLWLRRWDDLNASTIRDTQVGLEPSVSPGGDEVAFTQGGEVKIINLQGGPIRTLANGNWPYWADDGYIYLSADSGLVRILATGGQPEVVSRRRENEVNHFMGDVLPDGRGALIMVSPSAGTVPEMFALDFEDGELHSLGFGVWPRYAPTGHMTYVVGGTLMAAPFDARSREVTGPAVALLGEVGAFKMSRTGKLLYSPGGAGGDRYEMVWVTRAGQATPVEQGWVFDPGGSNAGWSLSPDGQNIALRELTDAGLDIWIKSLDGPRSRLTFAETEDRKPTWAPDGESVTFLSARSGQLEVWSKRADGTGEAVPVFAQSGALAEISWTPDGTGLLIRSGAIGGQLGGRDISVVRPATDSVATPLLSQTHDEISPRVSPDGRWLAYASNETGQHEIFIRPFPNVESGRWQVSTGGGHSPVWSHDGRELSYMDSERRLVASQIQATASAVRVTSREILFDVPGTFLVSDIFVPYDVGADGRFLMARTYRGEGADVEDDQVILVDNWFEELKRRVPN